MLPVCIRAGVLPRVAADSRAAVWLSWMVVTGMLHRRWDLAVDFRGDYGGAP